MGQLCHLDDTVKKELAKGLRTPEGLWGMLVMKNGDFGTVDRGLPGCEFVNFLGGIDISEN